MTVSADTGVGGAPATAPSTRAGEMRLNVGCGWDKRDGYVNIDFLAFHGPDLVADIRTLPFDDGTVDEVVAQDVLEHLPRAAVPEALGEWSRVLRPGGKLMLRVPNLVGLLGLMLQRRDRDDQETLEQCLFGTQAYNGDFHQSGFTEILLRHRLHDAGFEVTSLIGHDEWLFDAEATKVASVGAIDLGALPYMRPGWLGSGDAGSPPVGQPYAALRQAIAEARHEADVDQIALDGTRLQAPKKAALRVMRVFSSRQAAHNRTVDDALALVAQILSEQQRDEPTS